MKEINSKKFIGEKEIKQYKQFAFKEDMIKMSIAFILGASFNKVVSGISDFLIMPILNFIVVQTGESWRKWSVEPLVGLKIELGQFLGVIIDFFLISIILYIIYGKIITKITNSNNSIELKKCPLCFSDINSMAKRCPRCTGDIDVQIRRIRK
jgi:large conductance mechanosensitive channel